MNSVQREVDIVTAAKILGVSIGAVRQKIRRKSLNAVKKDNRWYVILDETCTGVQETDSTSTVDTYSTGVQSNELALLRAELEQAKIEAEAAKVEANNELERLRDELDSARREVAASKLEVSELEQVKIEAAVAKAEVDRLEDHIQDLREHNAKLAIALDQEQQLHQSLQKNLSLPAPEPVKLSFFQRLFKR